MDAATQTMIENLRKNTGKSLDEWISIVRSKPFAKHGEVVSFLKSEHGFTHGFANLVALKARETDAGSASAPDEVVERQYQGKAHLRPIYDALVEKVNAFGGDVEIAPKNTYVSLRRKKQFAMLTPATKTRFEVGINLKGQEPEGILEAMPASNAMCSHRISLSSADEVGPEVVGWLHKAYEAAG